MMRFLNYRAAEDAQLLARVTNDWPIQFQKVFSDFHTSFHNDVYRIACDEDSGAMLPIRFIKARMFHPAQIMHAPVNNGNELDAPEQLLFFEKLIAELKRQGKYERLIQPHPFGILAACPKNSKFCEFGTYVVDLENQSPEQILSRFHPKYQKAVSHSERNGAEIKYGKNVLDDFYLLYTQTMNRAGVHSDSKEYFETLLEMLSESHIDMGVVYDEGNPVSGVFLLYTNYSAFLTHAGSASETRLYGATKLLNFEMMKRLQSKGVRKYDFVGVRLNNQNPSLEGIFRFKKGFGGDLKSGYLWKTDLQPFKASLYDALLKIKSKGKLAKDIIDQVNG
ncbi:MAG TPA: peptidoglycan bridge formation glycyltransferase FemA/FemB family protein [Bacteroidia bacterium]|nr:peptidoglycan bridge formation glycyltransferase FemA/FemB family protein [Bacteroidia bacterium]